MVIIKNERNNWLKANKVQSYRERQIKIMATFDGFD